MATATRTPAAEIISMAKIERPLNWDELGSSAKDLWEERQLRSIANTKTPLDVWLLFDEPDDEEPSHEGNTFYQEDGTFRTEWYHVSVGLVTEHEHATYAEAEAFWENAGYQDFSS